MDFFQGCQPYEIAPCEHHVNGSRMPCSGEGHTPQCVKSCESSYPVTYEQDLHKGNKDIIVAGLNVCIWVMNELLI